MKNDNNLVTILITLCIFSIFEGFLYYWCGYLSGIFMTWFIGNRIVEGLSILGINITVHQIPMVTGTLAALGCFFGKTSSIKTSNN